MRSIAFAATSQPHTSADPASCDCDVELPEPLLPLFDPPVSVGSGSPVPTQPASPARPAIPAPCSTVRRPTDRLSLFVILELIFNMGNYTLKSLVYVCLKHRYKPSNYVFSGYRLCIHN